MKNRRQLASLEKSQLRSINRFTRDISLVNSSLTKHELELRVGYIAINLLNSWANFVRHYYVTCAQGAISPSGGIITSNLSAQGHTFNDLIGLAITRFKPNATPKITGLWDSRDEPTWHAASTLITLAKTYSFSNLNDVETAFTFGFTAHRDLVVFRNYYGHKNMNTRRKAQDIALSYSIQSNLHPTESLLRQPSGSASRLLDVWKTELTDTIQYLCS